MPPGTGDRRPAPGPAGSRRRDGRTRLGNLLLLLGALLIVLPAACWVRDELDHRRRLAGAPQPSPVMLARPGDPATGGAGSNGSENTGIADGTAHGASDGSADGAAATATDGETADAADGAASDTGAGPAPGSGTGSATASVTPLYHISIPRLGVTYPVGEGVDNPVLDLGPGHYPQTVLPGEAGNAALAGHRTRRGRPSFFYRLDALEPGDLLQIHYPGRSLTFVVERVFITDPYDLSVIAPTDYPALTLTTCDPPGSDEMRLIVRARLQSPLAAGASPG